MKSKLLFLHVVQLETIGGKQDLLIEKVIPTTFRLNNDSFRFQETLISHLALVSMNFSI